MKKIVVFLLAGMFILATGIANAVPVSVGDAISGSGDGLNSRWVNTSYRPHNVDSAIASLALDSTDTRYIGEINQVVSAIDFTDNYNNDGLVKGYELDPLTPDNSFAVGYYGFLNITTSDTYSFNAYTDDGFRLTIGGEMISQHYGDRAPGSTPASIFLDAGFYDFTMIGWEQGGQFVNELTWHDSSSSRWALLDSENLFTTNPAAPVPEPATMFLLATGLIGLAGLKRRKK